jgi:hypothetical protein
MEKNPIKARPQPARWALALVAVLAFLIWPIPLPQFGDLSDNAEAPVTWDEIIPSKSLEYHNCGDEFQCARLEVPMDYNRTDGKGRTFALAVVRLPAKVPVTDPRYGGAVLINPGESVGIFFW